MAERFFGRDREQWTAPGFAHQTRWRSTAALQRLFTDDMRHETQHVDIVQRLLADLPAEFRAWAPLAQDQYLEARTLLAGYLLASQGDRMLMAHSVEGRVPFLDNEVVDLANSLPARYKLRGLDEKHVLKRAARGLVPEAVIRRPKQPYRAPNAQVFAGADAPEWADELMGAAAVSDAGVFEPQLVAKLWRKCREGAAAPFSNADDMALTGVLSTQLLHAQFIRQVPAPSAVPRFRTCIDRLAQPVTQ
jgi:asparagine synthase (glutamine-hydrolysing)